MLWLDFFFNSIDKKLKKQEMLMVKIKVRYQLLILIFSMLISYQSTLFSKAFKSQLRCFFFKLRISQETPWIKRNLDIKKTAN